MADVPDSWTRLCHAFLRGWELSGNWALYTPHWQFRKTPEQQIRGYHIPCWKLPPPAYSGLDFYYVQHWFRKTLDQQVVHPKKVCFWPQDLWSYAFKTAMRRSDFEQSQGQGGRVVVPWLVEVGSVSKKIGRESTSAMMCLLLGIPIAEMCIFVLSKMNNSKLLQGTLVWWLILKVWRPSAITLLKLDLKMDMQEMVWGKKGLNIAAGGPSGRRISGSLCEFGTSQGPVAPEQRRHGLYAGPSQLVPWMRKLGLWWKEMGWRQLQYCTEKLKWIFDAYPFYQKYIYIYIYICIYIYIHMSMTYTHIHICMCMCMCIQYTVCFFPFIYRHV